MKAVVLDAFGGPEVLKVRDVPDPAPSPGQLLVRVFACGANPVDAQMRADGDWAGATPPVILGCDVSGVVEAVGDGVTEFAPGDEVFYMAEFVGAAPGGYAELNAVDATVVAHKPPGLSHLEAASLPIAAGTAALAVRDRLAVSRGEWLMVQGASGGVGGYAVQLGKALGAHVVACASARRHGYLGALGADVLVDYTDGDPFERAARAAGRDLDAVLDCVGHGSVARALPYVCEFGRVATIVEMQGDLELAIDRNITVHGVLARPSRTLLESLGDYIARGALRPLVDAVFSLDQITELHERLDSGHGQGKAVLALPALDPGSASAEASRER